MTDVEVFENYESEVRSYCRSFPAVFTTSKGSIMKDENGKEYIDFFCGAGALNYGHNNDYIKEKMVAYLMSDGIMHSDGSKQQYQPYYKSRNRHVSYRPRWITIHLKSLRVLRDIALPFPIYIKYFFLSHPCFPSFVFYRLSNFLRSLNYA